MTGSDGRALQELIAHIEELGGQQAMPVVALDTFFSGNAEEASIAPNVEPHPGVPGSGTRSGTSGRVPTCSTS